MTNQEKTIYNFCGKHADWWPSTSQVKEMVILLQKDWKGLTDDEIDKVQLQVILSSDRGKLERDGRVDDRLMYRAIEQRLREKNT